MPGSNTYDVAIIGGGLAGLALSIQLAQAGRQVILFEKNAYPFHRVCGEYISMESWDFLERLGVQLHSMQLPRISRLQVSAPDGFHFTRPLPLGGFGISRYTLDAQLAALAVQAGVHLHTEEKVTKVLQSDGVFHLITTKGTYSATLATGAFGKRSNLDVQWQRPFARRKKGKLNNYIGVKYHVRLEGHPADLIALHNFRDGYCGISQVEDNKYCLCYLTTAKQLEQHGNDIRRMEEAVLWQNPHLRHIFTTANFEWAQPETIAQVSFEAKTQVERHLLMAGDAAGMITPLCGNGMSMALHSSQLAAGALHAFLEGRCSQGEMVQQYVLQWRQQFARRLRVGRFIQSTFGRPALTSFFLKMMHRLPVFADILIRQTHGKPF